MPRNKALKENYFAIMEKLAERPLDGYEKILVTPIHESYLPGECPHFITSWANATRDCREQVLICCQCGETLERRLRL